MKYALNISNRLERTLKGAERFLGWSADDVMQEYQKALATVVKEDEGRTQAGGNIIVGDYILIIDSDTRIPKYCFLDAVS